MFRLLTLFLGLQLLLRLPMASAAEPGPTTDPEEAALAQQLTAQYGPDFLKNLAELKATVKDYVYATRLTQVGIQKVQESDFEDARYLLEKAYSIVPSPNLLYWLGMTCLGLDDALRARAYFMRFLTESDTWRLTAIKPDLLAATRIEIARLEKSLIRLSLTVAQAEAKVYIDGEFVGKTPLTAPIYLTQGEHQVIVIKAGFARHAARLQLTGAGRTIPQDVTLFTEAEQVRRTQLFRDSEARRLHTQRRLFETRRKMQLDAEARRAAYAKWANITLISGAVLATATLTFGLITQHYDDRIEGAPADTPWKELAGDQEKADFFRTTTIAALGATLLSLGVSTWFTQLAIPPARERTRVSLTPLAAPSTFGLALSFDF